MARSGHQQSQPRHVAWSKLPAEELSPLLRRRYVSAANSTLAHFELQAGCLVPEHAHENEQICYVTEGALQFRMGAEEYTVRAGELLVIPPRLPHQARALEKTVCFDFFSPARADWAAKDDAYLRGGK